MRLEPCAVKIASTVLRGRSASNGTLLPDESDAARIKSIIRAASLSVPFLPQPQFTTFLFAPKVRMTHFFLLS